MTILDISVLIIILLFAVIGRLKGFIKAAFGFIPMLAATIASCTLQPVVGGFLRSTPLFSSLSESIKNGLSLDELIGSQANATQADIISGMNLPEALKNALLENNNPVIYNILDASGLSDYISGYIANMCINVLSFLVLFAGVFIAATLLLSAMDLISKLPVLNSLNKTLGLAVGLIQGLLTVWIAGIILTFLYYKPAFSGFFTMLEASPISLWLYNNNFLMLFIMKIFT